MLYPAESFHWRTADTLSRRIGRNEVRMNLLQVDQFLINLVVSVVANLLFPLHVIRVIVLADVVGELGVAGFGLGVCHGWILGTAVRS